MSAIVSDQFVFYFSILARFYSTVLIKGIVHKEDMKAFDLSRIEAVGQGCQFHRAECGRPKSAENFHFEIHVEIVIPNDNDVYNSALKFELDHIQHTIGLQDIVTSLDYFEGNAYDTFVKCINGTPGAKLLDIGGRERSGATAKIPDVQTTVFDVIEDKTVDVCGDAHELSKYFPEETFDCCLSISVFEHLVMPWKVALEIGKVLKHGGYVFIVTHQTVGMHDLPWDYFRFSSDSWDGIFNERTGFEIVDRESSKPNFIIPHAWSPEKVGSEKAAGYEYSAVVAKKVGDSSLEWPLTAEDVVSSSYPE